MRNDPIFLRRGLKLSHLRLIAAIADLGQVGLAADQLGITQPAASRLLAELEQITGEPMHSRTGRGITLTEQGRAMARRGQRVVLEIDEAGREVAQTGAGLRGHVRIGSVTGPALDHVLPAVRAARVFMPEVTVEIDVAPSDPLARQILDGRLDLSMSRIPLGIDPAGFDFHRMGGEPVVFVVRRGHPLAGVPDLTGEALMGYDWVMPGPGAILRRTVEAGLASHGLALPRIRLATSSFLLTLALVQQTNAIAPLARAVARQFGGKGEGPLDILPIDFGIEVEPFGMVTRAGAVLTPAAARIAQLIVESWTQASR